MFFGYNQYFVGCLKFPAIISLIIFCILFATVIYYTRLILQKKFSLYNAFVFLLGILIYGFLLYINIEILLHGGIYLFQEKESDAVEMRGYISAIRDLEEAEGYELPFHGDPGVQCTINDIKCIAIEQGSLEVGDYVLVRYLPKSRYVLYIGVIDESEPTS